MNNLSLKKLIFYLFLVAVSLFTVTGTGIYYLYSLDWLGISLTLFFSAIGIFYFAKLTFKPKEKKAETINTADIAKHFIARKPKNRLKPIFVNTAYLIPYLLLAAASYFLLFTSRTDNALTSPWQAVSTEKFFLAYIAATAYLIFLILKKYKSSLYLIIAHYFLSFSLLLIIFKIGYGYDPFIHQATVDLIDKQGAVEPKSFYYIGQYSIVLIAHKIFLIPAVWADKFLVPVLAALTLPPTIYLFFRKKISQQLSIVNCQLSILFLLILPFSVFTLTVPQNLAYLFLILSIFFALIAANKAEKILGLLLALSALAVHPIAGLPAMFFIITVFIYRRQGKRTCFNRLVKTKTEAEKICVEKPKAEVLILKSSAKKINLSPKNISDFLLSKNLFYTVVFILNAVSLPSLFYLAQKNNHAGGSTEEIAGGFHLPAIAFPRKEKIFLDFAYFFQTNFWLILIIIAAAAAYAIWRWRKKYGEFLILGGFSLSLLFAYFLTSQINFSFLINYERGDFANRILTEAFIFLLPVIALLLYKFAGQVLANKKLLKYSWLVFLVILVAVSLYGSYPRRDNFYNSHSFSVGKSDLEAVNWIEKDAQSAPYVVLADQQVSVAALWNFGFSRYFQQTITQEECQERLDGGVCFETEKSINQIYFYPIPTGGPLYQIYLDMVYKKPDRATALRASELTGADTVYFAINKYWTDFDKIVEQAKIEADSYQNLNNGDLYIFKYQK